MTRMVAGHRRMISSTVMSGSKVILRAMSLPCKDDEALIKAARLHCAGTKLDVIMAAPIGTIDILLLLRHLNAGFSRQEAWPMTGYFASPFPRRSSVAVDVGGVVVGDAPVVV